jgi:hypothetical protein
LITQKISVAGLGKIDIGLVCHASDLRKLGTSIGLPSARAEECAQMPGAVHAAAVAGVDRRRAPAEHGAHGGVDQERVRATVSAIRHEPAQRLG